MIWKQQVSGSLQILMVTVKCTIYNSHNVNENAKSFLINAFTLNIHTKLVDN